MSKTPKLKRSEAEAQLKKLLTDEFLNTLAQVIRLTDAGDWTANCQFVVECFSIVGKTEPDLGSWPEFEEDTD